MTPNPAVNANALPATVRARAEGRRLDCVVRPYASSQVRRDAPTRSEGGPRSDFAHE